MLTTVYYEDWQMQCCGETFNVGDTVDWDCIKITWDNMVKADYQYEAHGLTQFIVIGKVIEIYAINYQYEKMPDDSLKAISYTSKSIKSATGHDVMGGYLVVLEDTKITEE